MKISLWCCHASTVENGALSHKIDWILNTKRHQNQITGSRVLATLLKKWTFPIGQSGEVSRWRVCYQWGLPCLVYDQIQIFFWEKYKLKVRLNIYSFYTKINKKKHWLILCSILISLISNLFWAQFQNKKVYTSTNKQKLGKCRSIMKKIERWTDHCISKNDFAGGKVFMWIFFLNS